MDQNAYFGNAVGPGHSPAGPTGQAGFTPRPPGWRPPSDPVQPPGNPASNKMQGRLVFGALAAAALVWAGFVVFPSHKAHASPAAASAGLRTDVATIGRYVANYYVDHSDPLTVATLGTVWTVLNVDGSMVGNGQLAAADKVTSSVITGPGSWCVALAGPDAASPGWMDSSSGGVQPGRTCPQAS